VVVAQTDADGLDREVPGWLHNAERLNRARLELERLDRSDPLSFMLEDLEKLTTGRGTDVAARLPKTEVRS